MNSSGEEVAPVNESTSAGPPSSDTQPQQQSPESTADACASEAPTAVPPEPSESSEDAPPAETPADCTAEKASESSNPASTASRPSSTSTDVTQGATTNSSTTTGGTAATGKGTKDKDSDSEGDGAEEILEESPCKRWSKRREQVKQRDVPGIDGAFLAMDNETGNEVVWNEVQFSERKNFRAQEEKINQVFNNLMRLVHTNLVKFHKYWTDAKSEKPRIIFITEYMAAGCMSRFLQRSRKSGSLLSLKAWKKWTTQILSALNYLHSCTPPIVHGNVTCDTVFIQGNGLIKIGCVAPTAIHHHVKTFRENIKNMHYIAPEYDLSTTEADIYSFGICALEMAVPGGISSCCCSTPANGVATCPEKSAAAAENTHITQEMIQKGLESLEDPMQKSFIESCLESDPAKRPTARQLLLHTVLFEVHSLKLLAAHRVVDSEVNESLSEDNLRIPDPQRIAAVSKFKEVCYNDVPGFQVSLDKFLEDVGQGIYPLNAFAPLAHPPPLKLTTESSSPGLAESAATGNNASSSNVPSVETSSTLTMSVTVPNIAGSASKPPAEVPEPSTTAPVAVASTPSEGAPTEQQVNGFPGGAQTPSGGPEAEMLPQGACSSQVPPPGEMRSVVKLQATLSDTTTLTLLFQLDDDMNRQLTTEISESDRAENLVDELLEHGFITATDRERICGELEKLLAPSPPPSNNGDAPDDHEQEECAVDEEIEDAAEKRSISPPPVSVQPDPPVIEPEKAKEPEKEEKEVNEAEKAVKGAEKEVQNELKETQKEVKEEVPKEKAPEVP